MFLKPGRPFGIQERVKTPQGGMSSGPKEMSTKNTKDAKVINWLNWFWLILILAYIWKKTLIF